MSEGISVQRLIGLGFFSQEVFILLKALMQFLPENKFEYWLKLVTLEHISVVYMSNIVIVYMYIYFVIRIR